MDSIGARMTSVMSDPPTRGNRRLGPSRLSAWSGRRVAAFWIAWPGFILALCAIAVLLSIRVGAGLGEVRSDLTRENLIGLAMTVILPLALLTALWWRMRGRRRSSDAGRGSR